MRHELRAHAKCREPIEMTMGNLLCSSVFVKRRSALQALSSWSTPAKFLCRSCAVSCGVLDTRVTVTVQCDIIVLQRG